MEKAGSIKSRIVNEVIQDIVDGKYSSDDILTEKALIERFQVSKSPVRDALMELCANDVLKNIPRYGYQVVHIGREKMHEMIEFRFILESYCLRQSIHSITAQEIEELEHLEYEVQKDIQNNPDYPVTAHWKNNMEFHLLLASLARNKYIYSELQRTMSVQMRGYALYFQEHAGQERKILNMTSHTYIVEALKKGDVEQAIDGLKDDLGKIDLYNQFFSLKAKT